MDGLDGMDYIAGASASKKPHKQEPNGRDTLTKALVMAAAAAVAEHATADEVAKDEVAKLGYPLNPR